MIKRAAVITILVLASLLAFVPGAGAQTIDTQCETTIRFINGVTDSVDVLNFDLPAGHYELTVFAHDTYETPQPRENSDPALQQGERVRVMHVTTDDLADGVRYAEDIKQGELIVADPITTVEAHHVHAGGWDSVIAQVCFRHISDRTPPVIEEPAPEPKPDPEPEPDPCAEYSVDNQPAEDSDCWDCELYGNQICGPVEPPAPVIEPEPETCVECLPECAVSEMRTRDSGNECVPIQYCEPVTELIVVGEYEVMEGRTITPMSPTGLLADCPTSYDDVVPVHVSYIFELCRTIIKAIV